MSNGFQVAYTVVSFFAVVLLLLPGAVIGLTVTFRALGLLRGTIHEQLEQMVGR